MLRRDRQIRNQVHQLKDATLFVVALWLAYALRSHLSLTVLEGRDLQPFGQFAWLYLIIAPGAPLVLDLQGFYKRPLFCSRWITSWILFKGCMFVALGVIVVMFLFKMAELNRLVIIFFGGTSFLLMFLSEELLRWGYRSKFAQSQLKKRIMLVGTREDTSRMKTELNLRADEDFQIVAELD